ncbi:hypothetical protein JTB14_019608 [Gonioctena quinquepunctata]|nr:hypothetical protein JTB14_019608 [Gonioctena quinquepunctata]
MEEENPTNTPVYGDQKESNDNISRAVDNSLEIKIKMERLIIENECLKRLLEAETKQEMDEIINLANHDMEDEDNFTKVTRRRRRVMEGSGKDDNDKKI